MMEPRLQKRLAILGALIAAGLFAAANLHLVTVAVTSQPNCVPPLPGKAPARPSC